jgi:hypothetical protein
LLHETRLDAELRLVRTGPQRTEGLHTAGTPPPMVGCYTRTVGRWPVDGSGGGRPAVTRVGLAYGLSLAPTGAAWICSNRSTAAPRASSPDAATAAAATAAALAAAVLSSWAVGARLRRKGSYAIHYLRIGVVLGPGELPCHHHRITHGAPALSPRGNLRKQLHIRATRCSQHHCNGDMATLIHPASFQNRGPGLATAALKNACQHADQTGKYMTHTKPACVGVPQEPDPGDAARPGGQHRH